MRNLITDVLPAESVVPNEQAGEHSIDEDTQVLGDEQGEEPDPKRKRMVNEPLTPAQEEELVEWYRENAYLWNKRLKKYKLKCDKITEKERKAAELGITIQRLDTWLDTTQIARKHWFNIDLISEATLMQCWCLSLNQCFFCSSKLHWSNVAYRHWTNVDAMLFQYHE